MNENVVISANFEKSYDESDDEGAEISKFCHLDDLQDRKTELVTNIKDDILEAFFIKKGGDMVDFEIFRQNFCAHNILASFIAHSRKLNTNLVVWPMVEKSSIFDETSDTDSTITTLKEISPINLFESLKLSTNFCQKFQKPEDGTIQTHQQFMMREMVRLSKDFETEHRFKKSAARYFAIQACRARISKISQTIKIFSSKESQAKVGCEYISYIVKQFWRNAYRNYHFSKERDSIAENINLCKHICKSTSESELLAVSCSRSSKESKANHFSAKNNTIQHDQIFPDSSLTRSTINNRVHETRKRKKSTDSQTHMDIQPLKISPIETLSTPPTHEKFNDIFPDDIHSPNHTLPKLTLFEKSLRPYQEVGVEWLVSLFQNDLNGVLADEKGMGKKVQIIKFFAYLAEQAEIWGPHIIITSNNDIPRWLTEFKLWCPGLNAQPFYETYHIEKLNKEDKYENNSSMILITHIEFITSRLFFFNNQPWCYIIIDNMTRLDYMERRAILQIPFKKRIILHDDQLTLSKFDLDEIISHIIPHHDSVLSILSDLDNYIYLKQGCDLIEKYSRYVGRFIMGRKIIDVYDQMPQTKNLLISCHMTTTQITLYYQCLDEAYNNLSKLSDPSLFEYIKKLVDICTHPYLVILPEPISPFVCPSIDRDDLQSLVSEFDLTNPHLLFSLSEFDPTADAVSASHGLTHTDQIVLYKEWKQRISDVVEHRHKPDKDSDHSYFKLCKCTYDCKCSFNSPKPDDLLNMNIPHLRDYIMKRCEVNMLRPNVNYLRPLYGSRLLNILKFSADFNKLKESELYNSLFFLNKVYEDYTKFQCVVPAAITTYNHPMQQVLSKSIGGAQNLILHDRKKLIYESGKMIRLNQMLADLCKKSTKVVIIFRKMKTLNIVKEYLCFVGKKYLRIDHTCSIEETVMNRELFNKSRSVFCMLTTTKTDFTIMNILNAEHFIFYEMEWDNYWMNHVENYLKYVGYSRQIIIYKMYSKSTIEHILNKVNIFDPNLETQSNYVKTAIESIKDSKLKSIIIKAMKVQGFESVNSKKSEQLNHSRVLEKFNFSDSFENKFDENFSRIQRFAMHKIAMDDGLPDDKGVNSEILNINPVNNLFLRWKTEQELLSELNDLERHASISLRNKDQDNYGI